MAGLCVKLLADDFARNGFKTIAPDTFDDEPVPADALTTGNFDFNSWGARHPPARGLEILIAVIDSLKAEGVTKFGGLGYCFGGRLCFDLVYAGRLAVVATSHPSLLKVPEDLEKYAQTSVPILINSCETDSMFGQEAQKAADEILGNGKFTPGYLRTYWPGCVHGYAVRGDMVRALFCAVSMIELTW